METDAARALNSAGLTALVKQIREGCDATGATRRRPGESFPRDAAYARRRWGDALRSLCRAQKDVEAYLALAQETGLTPADCLALAMMLVARRKTEDALTRNSSQEIQED